VAVVVVVGEGWEVGESKFINITKEPTGGKSKATSRLGFKSG
jgi:hypothetical protein